MLLSGDSSRGRTEVVESAEGGIRHHQRIVVGTAAALPADAQHHLRGEELDHHLSTADGNTPPLHEARRRAVVAAVVGRRDAADAGRRAGQRRCRWVPQKRLDEEQRRRCVDSAAVHLWLTVSGIHGKHERTPHPIHVFRKYL